MATLCQIFTFHKYPFSSLPSRHTTHCHYLNIPRFQNSIFASIKKPRGRRQVRSNDDLCSDIREFLSVAGFPQDHVPTTKELAQHGRQDLANIVRRRGYKVIRELLGTSKKPIDGEPNSEEGFTEGCANISPGQDEKMKNVVDDASSFIKASVMDSRLNSVKDGKKFNSHKQSYVAEESSIYPSLQEKASNFIQNGELDNIYLFRNDYPPAEEAKSDEDKSAHVKTQKVENQAEISRLKFILHQKELELTSLKQQVEEEKRTLSALQNKAEAEMSKAHKAISDKDAELNSAEESLSGLKEVEIQYRGDGESVEVAGSFNGWHHRIKMDPQASSSILEPTGLRKSQLWRTVLWLYPGIYEIKFVIDGHWRTDPERELVTRGVIENNVLRVER